MLYLAQLRTCVFNTFRVPQRIHTYRTKFYGTFKHGILEEFANNVNAGNSILTMDPLSQASVDRADLTPQPEHLNDVKQLLSKTTRSLKRKRPALDEPQLDQEELFVEEAAFLPAQQDVKEASPPDIPLSTQGEPEAAKRAAVCDASLNVDLGKSGETGESKYKIINNIITHLRLIDKSRIRSAKEGPRCSITTIPVRAAPRHS
jgi:hypothetical protein